MWPHSDRDSTQETTQVQTRQKPSTGKGKWKQSSTPSQSYLQLIAVEKGGGVWISFLKWSLTGFMYHTQGQSPFPGTSIWPAQNGLCVYVVVVVLICFGLIIFLYFSLLVLNFIFVILCLRNRKGTWSKIERWGRSERSWEGEEYDQNILYKNTPVKPINGLIPRRRQRPHEPTTSLKLHLYIQLLH